jgi:hypothetical protein
MPSSFPALTFANLTPIALGAQALKMNVATPVSRQPPNVEHLSPVSFNDAVTAWADRRFEPNGVGDTVIEITVEEGSIIERALDVDGGIRGMLKKEQAAEYEARLKLTIRAVGPDRGQRASAAAEVWRTQTIGEDASLSDRQAALLAIVEETVNAMDTRLMPDFRRYFADYIL